MYVIKLGGSLYYQPHLSTWLTHLQRLSQHRDFVIVPGGGPFADQVRQAQQDHYGLDDQHAHHMAILAMSQFGLLLTSLNQQLTAFNYSDSPVSPKSRFSIWLPDNEVLQDPTLPKNWEVSSDSLALWLAQKINAKKLTLVKAVTEGDLINRGLLSLTKAEIIDRHFTHQLSLQTIPVEVIAASQIQHYDFERPNELEQ